MIAEACDKHRNSVIRSTGASLLSSAELCVSALCCSIYLSAIRVRIDTTTVVIKQSPNAIDTTILD